MSGLECSEVNLSSVIPSGEMRIDSEHFKKVYKTIQERLISISHTDVLSIIQNRVKTGHTPSMKELHYYGGNIAFIKTDNIRTFFISSPYTDYLSDSGNEKIKGSQLRADDVLLTIIGADLNVIARAALVTESDLPANINQNLALLRVDKKKYSPEMLMIYLNSFWGRHYVYYLSRQTEQFNLNCREVEKVIIPSFSERFQQSVISIVKLAYGNRQESNEIYSETERFLLSILALDTFVPSQENTSFKNFSEISASGRLDAEYYQKKYDDLFSTIHHAAKNPNVAIVAPLSSVVSIKKSMEPGRDEYGDEGIPFVRVSDISKFEVNPPDIFLDRQKFDIDGLKPKKNTILLSKDGSVGIAYKVNEDMDAITSGALLHLTVTDETVNPDYLTLLLNSFVVGMQAERDVGGSILKHWRVDEIKKVQLPILQESIQQKIAEKIRHSFTLRERSKALLKAATRAVEIAIEEDEAAAMEFLREKTMQENV